MSNDMLKHAQILQRYMYAMKDGDIETVAALLEDAEQDRALENMLLEVNAAYQEERPPILKNDIVQAKHLVLTLVNQATRRETMQDPIAYENNSAQTSTVLTTEQPRSTDPVSPGRKVLTLEIPARTNAKQKWYRSPKSWITSLVAVMLVSFLLLQSNSALASQILAFLHYQPVPQKVLQKAVNHLTVTMEDLGTFATTEKYTPPVVLTRDQVVHEIHFPLVLPQHLPQQVSNNPSFIVQKGSQGRYTFSAAKARAYLKQIGHGNIHIPANLDGATFRFTQGTSAQALYEGSDAAPAYGHATFLMVTETPRLEVQATGKASVQNLRDFLLSLPNVSPVAVSYLIQNNGIMPFPVPDGMQFQSVTVHQISGLVASNNTKMRVVNTQSQLSTMLEWQENDINYMITGSIDGYSMNADQLLTAANSLH